ncbi:MAG: TlpA family protein disulfide reductase, partial [bacterium]
MLNLWATWCGPCRAEMPLLAKAQREHPEVLFVLVNQGETEATILAYLQREGLRLDEVWRDPVSAMGPAVGSSGLPTTVFFDAQGRRQGAHVGVLSEAAIRVIVRTVAAPSGSS